MPSPDYIMTAVVRATADDDLLRAVRTEDQHPVLLKVLRAEHPAPQQLARLQRELDIAGPLHSPCVLQPLCGVTYQKRPALLFEDFDGADLEPTLGAPLPLRTFLHLASQLAAALAAVHDAGVVHKDVKPAHILVSPSTGQLKLTGFGLASRLQREHAPARGPSQIEGTLAYMSPEQTGRMNLAVDRRSDLYSLGVTLYQMLTGSLPFQATDPLGWVHCHIALSPRRPADPAVPPIVADLVMRLLSKSPADRYQSARSLYQDLARCLAAWERDEHIPPFPLGRSDVPDLFEIPHRLYGRQRERQLLLECFDQVMRTGAPVLVLISGYAGVGKSSLVNEIQQPVVRSRGTLLNGKFDEHRRDIPYFTFVQALRELILEILAEPEERVRAMRAELLGALGKNGQLIIDVIPQLELIIGPQPKVPAMALTEAANRFMMVFRRFIDVLATGAHPLVLFLDDLQWSDGASLQLLQHLVTASGPRHLLILGAYRDNEVGPEHPLRRLEAEIRGAGAPVHEIHLAPLLSEHICQLVADTLRCGFKAALPLGRLVHQKTGGNPFFAIQFLATLHRERLLEFDPMEGAFRWDIEQIQAQGYTDNVVELMAGRLRQLPAHTRELLSLLASAANAADLRTLEVISERPPDSIAADLSQAVREGLLLQTGARYRFLHDRVQQAAYSLIPEAERPAVHLRIGRLLWAQTPAGQLDEQLFDVVNQLNRGAPLIDDPTERERLCRLNQRAGRKARASIAYGPARSYLSQARALLADTGHDEAFALDLDLAECEFLCGHFEDADRRLDGLLSQARTDEDRARAYNLRLRLYQVAGRYAEGVRAGLTALSLFGVDLPDRDEDLEPRTRAETERIRRALTEERIAALPDAELAADPRHRAVLELLVNLLPCAYIARPALFPLLCVTAVGLSLRNGNTADSCFVYSVYAFVLISLYEDISAGFALSEASLRLNERLRDQRLRGTLLHIHGDHVNFWRRPIATDFPYLIQGFDACVEVGELGYAGYLAFETVWQALERGDALEDVQVLSQRYEAFARQTRNQAVLQTIRLEQQFVRALQGRTRAEAGLEDDSGFTAEAYLDVVQGASFGCGVAFFHISQLILLYTYGRYEEALGAAEQASGVLGAAMAMPIEATYYFYHALTVAALVLAPQRGGEVLPHEDLLLDEHLRRLHVWARHCPANFQARACLLGAEVARLRGRIEEAMRLYEQAVASAREHGLVHHEALSYELAGGFYLSRGFETFGDLYLREARACYLRWGADGKVRHLDRRYPHLLDTRPLAPTATLQVPADQLELLSVVKATQSISREIVLPKLLERLVQVLIEHAGAQRGCLLLGPSGALSLRAEGVMAADGVRVQLFEAAPAAPRATGELVPLSAVQLTARTGQSLVLTDAAAAPTFADDEYVARHRVRSLLCVPISRQGGVVGVLYLENNLVADAFTSSKLELLEIVAAQAAISLENATLYAALQEAVGARDEFLSIASHELRTPLSSMQLALQSLLRQIRTTGGVQPEQMAQLLGAAERQTHRLSRLVGNLMDVSRIQARRLAFDLSEFDLAALLRDVAAHLQQDLARAGCALELTAPAPVIGCWDRGRLDQVVTNLLSNALKYGAGRPIRVRVEQDGGDAVLMVEDEGIGIPPEMQERIFERFERAVSARHFGGFGLGLFIVRGIVRGLGGQVTVDSPPERGARFTVRLPLRPPPEV